MKKVTVNTKERNWKWATDRFSTAIVEDDGAIKWESNGRYLMEDVMANIIANGFTDFSVEATNEKRDAQNSEFINDYRANYKEPSKEEIEEMRAAFGTGKTIVDVLTGKEIRL